MKNEKIKKIFTITTHIDDIVTQLIDSYGFDNDASGNKRYIAELLYGDYFDDYRNTKVISDSGKICYTYICSIINKYFNEKEINEMVELTENNTNIGKYYPRISAAFSNEIRLQPQIEQNDLFVLSKEIIMQIGYGYLPKDEYREYYGKSKAYFLKKFNNPHLEKITFETKDQTM